MEYEMIIKRVLAEREYVTVHDREDDGLKLTQKRDNY